MGLSGEGDVTAGQVLQPRAAFRFQRGVSEMVVVARRQHNIARRNKPALRLLRSLGFPDSSVGGGRDTRETDSSSLRYAIFGAFSSFSSKSARKKDYNYMCCAKLPTPP